MIFLLIVTLTSLLLAAIMSVIAWRLSGDERRRSDERVAALAEDIRRAGDGRGRITPHGDEGTPWRGNDLASSRSGNDPAGQGLFAPPPPSRSWRSALLAGVVVLVSAAVSVAALGSGQLRRVLRAADSAGRAPAAVVAAPPLELVALGHERAGDQLTVRGVVRNPASGAPVDRLTAVVLLFTPDGGFLTSGRAVVDAPALRPGGESTFAVTVPRAGDVGRYRVSFRADDKLIPHLDRRHET
jgi:hypothetical protein